MPKKRPKINLEKDEDVLLPNKKRRKILSTPEEVDKNIKLLQNWMDTQLRMGSVPRMMDVVEYASRAFKNVLTLEQVKRAFRLHPSYNLNTHQQRERLGSRKDRPILTNTLGMLHADLGFFPVTRDYETPKTFRYGFMVARDILSRYTYIDLLKAEKSAATLVRSLRRLLLMHKQAHHDYPIVSIAFDKETGMRSELVREFLKEQNIRLVFFKESRSKAKMAENAIRLIRTKVSRLMRDLPARRWWSILGLVARDLNSQEILVGGKRTGFAPRDVNSSNVRQFVRRLQKAAPSRFFSQFRIAPELIKYRFKPGDIVRPKSIVVSSQVLGVKRSQVNLGPQTYEIISREPFVTQDLSVRPLYKCRNTLYGDIEIFSEQDIALSSSLNEDGIPGGGASAAAND